MNEDVWSIVIPLVCSGITAILVKYVSKITRPRVTISSEYEAILKSSKMMREEIEKENIELKKENLRLKHENQELKEINTKLKLALAKRR